MKIVFEPEIKYTRPIVNAGDILVTSSGRRVIIVKDKKSKYVALDLNTNILCSSTYDNIEELLHNYSHSYTVYSAKNIELAVKGVGEKWQ